MSVLRADTWLQTATRLHWWRATCWDGLVSAEELVAAVVIVDGFPWPTQFRPGEPFACEFVPVAAKEGVFRMQRLERVPVRVAHLTLFSKDW